MSHISIVISRSPSYEFGTGKTVEPGTELTYSYTIPVPHGATPRQVGNLVREAFMRLEDVDDDKD